MLLLLPRSWRYDNSVKNPARKGAYRNSRNLDRRVSMQEKPSFSDEQADIIGAPEVISTGMAIGAGFVTDVFAGFALDHVRETASSLDPFLYEDAEYSVEIETEEQHAEIVPVTQREMRYVKPVLENAQSSIAFSGEGTGVIGSIELLDKTYEQGNYVVKIVNDTPEMLFCSTAGECGQD